MPSRTTQRPKETLKLKPQLKMMTLYYTVHYGTVRLWMHAVERFQPQHFTVIIIYCIIVISYQRIHQHVLSVTDGGPLQPGGGQLPTTRHGLQYSVVTDRQTDT